MLFVIDVLSNSPYIKLQKDEMENGNLVISKGKEYSLRKLSNSEIELIKCIAETFKDIKGKTLSNQTHKEKPWLSTSDFAVIDYSLAEGLDLKKILPTL